MHTHTHTYLFNECLGHDNLYVLTGVFIITFLSHSCREVVVKGITLGRQKKLVIAYIAWHLLYNFISFPDALRALFFKEMCRDMQVHLYMCPWNDKKGTEAY